MVFSKSVLIETVPNTFDGKQLSTTKDDVLVAPEDVPEEDDNTHENQDGDATEDREDNEANDYIDCWSREGVPWGAGCSRPNIKG